MRHAPRLCWCFGRSLFRLSAWGYRLHDPVGESQDDQLFPAGGVALWSEGGMCEGVGG